MANNGTFSGNPKAEWLNEPGDDRRMRLLDDFWYEDPGNKRWSAPAGSVIDGASIPAPLWSVVGSPYTGEYRRASVVHDVACNDPSVPRKDADRMFYYACLAGGCSPEQARILYAGVRIGARVSNVRLWTEDVERPSLKKGAIRPTLVDESVQTTFGEIARDLTAMPDDAPFEALESMVDRHLNAKASQ